MARFDLYSGVGSGKGYVVDVQADLLESLATRVVIRCCRATGPKRYGILIRSCGSTTRTTW